MAGSRRLTSGRENAVSTDEQAIRHLIGEWHRATAAGDVDAILPLMAEDVVFLVARKPPMRGRDAFENGLRSILKTQRIESAGDIQEIQISGDLAYCWSVLNVRMSSLGGGDATERSGHVLSVLRKQPSGAWQIARDANLLEARGA
jgi:uncharacterized protein (TIGR02246 family)